MRRLDCAGLESINPWGYRLFLASMLVYVWPIWFSRRRGKLSLTKSQSVVIPRNEEPARPDQQVSDDKIRTPSQSFNQIYKVGKKLGTGAFSVAYEAMKRSDPKCKVAVKITKKKNLSADIAHTIRSEIDIMRTLDHPNIVKYIAHYEEENYWFVVLELMEGGEVFDRIVKKSKYDEKEARDLVYILLGAVQYIHSRGIVHRDLKLENLLLQSYDDNATVKVCDFGFAKYASSSTLLTQCGSPLYVAPEIVNKEPYGKAADMWAIGVITYILLGGYPPFQDDGKQSILFANIKSGNYRFDKEYWAHISPEAQHLIAGLLTLDPTKRITVDQALAHPWLARSGSELAAVNLDVNLKQLRRFQAKRKFRAAVSAVIAISKLSGMVISRQNTPNPSNMCSRSEYLRTPKHFDSDDEDSGRPEGRNASWSIGNADEQRTIDESETVLVNPKPTSSNRVRTYSDGTSSPWWN